MAQEGQALVLVGEWEFLIRKSRILLLNGLLRYMALYVSYLVIRFF